MHGRGGHDQQGGEPRGRQVHEVVEPGRGPAERLVARGAMADHAVGGVDRLVERAARQPADADPEGRRDDPVGEVLRQALDGGAADPGLVQGLRVAPDDHRHRVPSTGQPFGAKPGRDAGDVLVQAALGRQAGAEEGEHRDCRQRPG